MNGLLIAAPSSNSGKTFITLGLLRALKNHGLNVASAKVGPDYIDPAFHAAASQNICPNLDGWAMRDETLSHILSQLEDRCDLTICEGVMGLFDGATLPADSIDKNDGSPADIARRTGWPVVLVIDATAQATSAAAMIHGFKTFDPDVHVKGVIFNKVGGPGHIKLLENAVLRHTPDVKILGFVPRQKELALPERHLGLVLAQEHPQLEEFLNQAAAFLTQHINLEEVIKLAAPQQMSVQPAANALIQPLGQSIAVAKDEAFAFAYPALLSHWQTQGAEISFFSPLQNEAPALSCDAIYLPGGYPELHAQKLAGNLEFLSSLRQHHEKDHVIFGECGGYMTLGQTIEDKDGLTYEMAGILELATSFAKRKLHLGYRDVVLESPSILGDKGTCFRGHEFHYASILSEDGNAAFRAKNALGEDLGVCGLTKGRTLASFIHLIDHRH